MFGYFADLLYLIIREFKPLRVTEKPPYLHNERAPRIPRYGIVEIGIYTLFLSKKQGKNRTLPVRNR